MSSEKSQPIVQALAGNTELPLLKEYEINVEFWKHHDAMRQTKMGNFLTTNTILAAAIALLTSSFFTALQSTSIALIVAISIIGSAVSFTWYAVMGRNSEYMRFQRLQLCCIEESLLNSQKTFTKMYHAFDRRREVFFPKTSRSFSTKRISATKLEGALPLAIAVSWAVIAVSCIVFLAFTVFAS